MRLHRRPKPTTISRLRRPSGNRLRRATTLELLEGRVLLAADAGAALSPWQNHTNPHDVNHDHRVSSVDALLVINDLLVHGPHSVPSQSATPLVATDTSPIKYVDVNGDKRVTSADALLVVNHLLVTPLAVTALAEFRVEAQDLSGTPITSVNVGQDFQIAAIVEDIRTPPNQFPGVWAAFMNVVYDSNLVSITATPNVPNPGDPGNNADLGIEFGDYFDTGLRFGDLNTPGQIAEIGSSSLAAVPAGVGEKLLWRIHAHASSGGMVTFDAFFDSNVDHESSFINPPDVLLESEILFGDFTLQVVGPTAISVADQEVFEGDSGQTQMVFTVSLASPATDVVTVKYATQPGTATTADNDYVATSGTLAFQVGQQTQLVTVLVNGDTNIETNETFTLVLSDPDNGSLADGVAVGTIKNDEVVPTLAIANLNDREGNTGGGRDFIFQVSLSEAAGQTIVVAYATADGSATTANNDYLPTSGTLTFSPGQTSKLITVASVGDTTVENDETFSVNLTPVSGALANGPIAGTGTILNDDPALQAIVRLQIVDALGNPLLPGAALDPNVNFTLQAYVRDLRDAPDGIFQAFVDVFYEQSLVMITGPITHGSEFSVQPAGDTSTLGLLDEIGGIGDGSPQFPAGQAFPEQLLFSVPFKAIGTGVAPFALIPAAGQNHDILRYDDDQPVDSGSVNFVNTSVTIGANVFNVLDVENFEGNAGTTMFVFAVQRFLPTDAEATVSYTTAPGTATSADHDYVPTSGSLSFAVGETIKFVTVLVNGDTKSEIDETFSVNLSNSVGADIFKGTGTGKIDNDDGLVDVSVSNASGSEGQAINFVVSLSAVSGQTVTVPFHTDVALAGNLATANQDYPATTGTLTFATGVTQRTVVVQALTDALLEPNETFRLVLDTPSGALLDQGEAQGTIFDVPPSATLFINNVAQVEGNSGNSNFVFTASLSNATTVPVVVSYTTADATATALGNDYIAQSGTLTFGPGQTTQFITVAVVGDQTIEPSETFKVNLAPLSGPIPNTPISGTGTITNDDGTPTLSVNDVSIISPSSGFVDAVFTVTLSSAGTQNVTVGFATQKFTAVANTDYLPQSGQLTFTPVGPLTQTITVPIIGIPTPEDDKTFFLNLSSVSSNAQIGDGQGVCTILHEGLGVGNVSVLEGNPDSNPQSRAVFNVILSKPQGHNVTVVYNTSPGTASAGSDYGSTSGTLTFTGNETSKLVTVNIVGDTTIEQNETFFLNLSNASGAPILSNQATGTIVNDDGLLARVRLQVADSQGTPVSTLDPNQTFILQAFVQDIQPTPQGVFQAFVDALYDSNLVEVTGPITFGPDFPVQPSGSTATSGLLDEVGAISVFPAPANPGDEKLLFSVPFQAIDIGLANFTLDPADLQDHVLLEYGSDEPLPASRVRFVDASVNIGRNVFTIANASVLEGDGGQKELVFTVNRFLPEESVATVVYSTENNTATAGSDYVPTSGTLTFAVGDGPKTITVLVNGDTTDEPDETFFVRLTGAVNANTSLSPGVGTILDDDGPVSVSIADASGDEGQDIGFVVTLLVPSGKTVIVPFATSPSTSGNIATAPSDYQTTAGSLTFAPGVTQQVVTVHLNGDILLEPSETFQVVLGTPTNGVLGDGQAQGTILDVPPALISGNVYVDLNKNGIRDGNESGIGNVIITATPVGGGTPIQTLTNDDGTYTVVGVLPHVAYNLVETQPGFYADGRDVHQGVESSTNDRFVVPALQPSQAVTGYDFGELGLRSEFVSIFINRRAFFASAIVTGTWGPHAGTGGTVNPRTGDVWISFDGGWDGQRTIDATFDSSQGTATMTLYNNDLQQVAVSTPAFNLARIVYTGTTGSAYFLRISGTNPSVSVSIGEPVAAGPLTASTSSAPPSGDTNVRASMFASSSTSPTATPQAAPQTSPSATDLVWAEDDDWVADSLVV
jgi:hypothetical protein